MLIIANWAACSPKNEVLEDRITHSNVANTEIFQYSYVVVGLCDKQVYND